MNLHKITTIATRGKHCEAEECKSQQKQQQLEEEKNQSFWVLHHVRLRGIHRRLCTSCVLRLHPSSFCPSCFTFYDSNPPPPSKRISCSASGCNSFTHSHCASQTSPIPSPFLCPPCSNPNFTFFNLTTKNHGNHGFIDKKMAAVLLCAAKIASASMRKAVDVARADAERKIREAVVCRKRAREALEHVNFLVNNNNNNMKKKTKDTAVAVTDDDDVVVDDDQVEVEPTIEQGEGGVEEVNRVLGSGEIVSNGNDNDSNNNGHFYLLDNGFDNEDRKPSVVDNRPPPPFHAHVNLLGGGGGVKQEKDEEGTTNSLIE